MLELNTSGADKDNESETSRQLTEEVITTLHGDVVNESTISTHTSFI